MWRISYFRSGCSGLTFVLDTRTNAYIADGRVPENTCRDRSKRSGDNFLFLGEITEKRAESFVLRITLGSRKEICQIHRNLSRANIVSFPACLHLLSLFTSCNFIYNSTANLLAAFSVLQYTRVRCEIKLLKSQPSC